MTIRIAGIGVSSGRHRPHDTLESLIFEAASAALADADLRRTDIDAVCMAASDQLDGRPISSMQLAGPSGGLLASEIKVGHDGIHALAAGVLAIEAGVHDTVIAISWTKASESPWIAATAVQADPIYEVPAGIHPLAHEAMALGEFIDRRPLDLDAVDQLVRNGWAASGEEPPLDSVLAWPLRSIHLPPATDAAVAVILARDADGPMIAGMATGSRSSRPGSRSNPVSSVAEVAQRAYDEAGGVKPLDCLLETTDRNVFRLCAAAIGLGVVTPRADVASVLARGERPQLNSSGGLWSGNPIYAAGLLAVARAVQGMRTGYRQAVVHSSFGISGNGDAVVVLRSKT